MSVLSDITITTLCTPPTHMLRIPYLGMIPPHPSHEPAWSDITHDKAWLEKACFNGHAYQLDPLDPLVANFKAMITPFYPDSIKRTSSGEKIASYGVSSYGYDLRAAPEYKLYAPKKPTLWKRLKALVLGESPYEPVDYKKITDDMFVTVTGPKIIIPPHGFILTRSVEYVAIPRDVLALCIGKSTIARVGINCLCTPIEPVWEGHITFEFHNTLDQPNTFYADEGVLQLVFLKGDRNCRTSYEDRGGKYNHQGAAIVLPRV